MHDFAGTVVSVLTVRFTSTSIFYRCVLLFLSIVVSIHLKISKKEIDELSNVMLYISIVGAPRIYIYIYI